VITPEQISQIVEENRDEAIRCLTEIIQVPSVTGEEESVSKVFTKWMESCGLEVETLYAAPGRPNLIAEWNGSQEGKHFVFNGHMDTFPPCEGGEGQFDPFAATISDGYMYGRGTSDMKGGDCAALMAVRLLRKMGFDPKGKVTLSYMSDEENGGWLGVKHMIHEGRLNGDFGICMEPTTNRIVYGHQGILRMKFTYSAEYRHAGVPYPGKDAMQKAVTAVNRLYALDELLKQGVDDPMGDRPCISVTMFHSGNTVNVHPGHAEFSIDRRFAPYETFESAKAQVLAIMDELKAEDPSFAYEYEILNDRPVLAIPKDDPFIQLAAKSYEQIMGKPAEVIQRSAGSDAANLYQAYGIVMPNLGAAVEFGEYGCGGVNERIKISEYLDSIKYYMMIVVNALS